MRKNIVVMADRDTYYDILSAMPTETRFIPSEMAKEGLECIVLGPIVLCLECEGFKYPKYIDVSTPYDVA